jgi:biopolymer transport protein ExbD
MAAIAQTPAAGKGKVRSRKRSTFIDMTPMVDLAFLLLTFFILTTTISKPFVVPLIMPEKSTDRVQPVKAARAITLVLGEKNKVYWYQGVDNPKISVTDFSSKGIRNVLREKNVAVEKMFIIIKPSDKSRYQNIIDILDEMTIGDYSYYAIGKVTPEDEALIAASHL